ncbi:MAG: hypothetical protein ACSHX0_07950 [Akkermansiaceae bacterium]
MCGTLAYNILRVIDSHLMGCVEGWPLCYRKEGCTKLKDAWAASFETSSSCLKGRHSCWQNCHQASLWLVMDGHPP